MKGRPLEPMTRRDYFTAAAAALAWLVVLVLVLALARYVV